MSVGAIGGRAARCFINVACEDEDKQRRKVADENSSGL